MKTFLGRLARGACALVCSLVAGMGRLSDARVGAYTGGEER